MTRRAPEKHDRNAGVEQQARDVVQFWRTSERNWFFKDAAFDDLFRERFLALHESIVSGERHDWLGNPEGALALILLTDQFPRNAFRGTPRMYASDELARHFAEASLKAGFWEKTEEKLRLFLCLPFAHSENLDDQERSVSLNVRLGTSALSHAEGHRDIIRRFGRFPHRNAILGRASTQAEMAFLQEGGFRG